MLGRARRRPRAEPYDSRSSPNRAAIQPTVSSSSAHHAFATRPGPNPRAHVRRVRTCHSQKVIYRADDVPSGFAGLFRADDGTRTHDLLHGNPSSGSVRFRVLPQKRLASRDSCPTCCYAAAADSTSVEPLGCSPVADCERVPLSSRQQRAKRRLPYEVLGSGSGSVDVRGGR
jgi:hypothetical protein